MIKCSKCEHQAKVKSGRYTGLCYQCRRKEYYKDHKTREQGLCKKWYSLNRESEIEKNLEYRKQNRELWEWYHNKDRFNGLKVVILDRDKNQCQVCETTENLITHHIDGAGYKSVSKEKVNNDIGNLITLCSPCHSALHHWQRQKRQLVSREDIVRTLVEAREVMRKQLPCKRSFLQVTN